MQMVTWYSSDTHGFVAIHEGSIPFQVKHELKQFLFSFFFTYGLSWYCLGSHLSHVFDIDVVHNSPIHEKSSAQPLTESHLKIHVSSHDHVEMLLPAVEMLPPGPTGLGIRGRTGYSVFAVCETGASVIIEGPAGSLGTRSHTAFAVRALRSDL